MTDPLAVPRDPSAEADDRFIFDCVVAIAQRNDLSTVRLPQRDRWVNRATRHGVLLPVVSALRAAEMTAPGPIEGVRRGAALRALSEKQDLSAIAAAMDAASVDWAVLKGPILNEVVFERPGSRSSFDLDVLVRPEQLGRAIEVLEKVGGRRVVVDWSARTWADGAEIPIVMPSGTVIDLHWDLVNRAGVRRAYALPTGDLLDRRVPRHLNGLVVPGLDDLDMVLHVLLHACLDGCGRLRALLDSQQCIAWLRGAGHSPRALAERARGRELSSPAWMVLSLTAELLDPSVADWTAAITARTLWVQTVHRACRRDGGSPLMSGLSRRLIRYTYPSTPASIAGLLDYASSRVRRLYRRDDTSVSGLSDGTVDTHFASYLDRVHALR